MRVAHEKTLGAREQATPRLQELRVTWRQLAALLDPRPLVLIDASGSHIGRVRTHAWAGWLTHCGYRAQAA